MGEWIKNLFVAIFGSHSELATILISMVPIVELRGAIPFGAAKSLWGENALSIWEAFAYSVLGSSLVCIILTFMFWPLFMWFKKTKAFNKLAAAIERKLNRNSADIDKKVKQEKNSKRIRWVKFFGVMLFVGVPLPLTGAWTGTCIAVFIGMSKLDTILSVISGNIIAGLLMTALSGIFADNTMIVFLAFLVLIALFVLYAVIKSVIRKSKEKKAAAKNADIIGANENIAESEGVVDEAVVEENVEENNADTSVDNTDQTALNAKEKLEENPPETKPKKIIIKSQIKRKTQSKINK